MSCKKQPLYNMIVFFVFFECATHKKHKFFRSTTKLDSLPAIKKPQAGKLAATAGIGHGDVRFQLHDSTKNLLRVNGGAKC